MERTQENRVAESGDSGSHYLPDWIKRVLSHAEAGETFEAEPHPEPSEMSLQIARWNLHIVQELIRQGLWSPTSENRKTLHRLYLRYNISPLA